MNCGRGLKARAMSKRAERRMAFSGAVYPQHHNQVGSRSPVLKSNGAKTDLR
jgi:hypothetical protein